MKILVAFLCFAVVGIAYGAVMRGMGDCPDGNQPGDTWYPDGCMRCNCEEGGYTCYSCSPMALPPGAPCYLAPSDPGANYPDCCPSPVCMGDPNFDESQLGKK